MYHVDESLRLFASVTVVFAPSRLIVSARVRPFFTALCRSGGVDVLLPLHVLLQVAILHQLFKVRLEGVAKFDLVPILFVVVAVFIRVPV